jgi:hypothetical protein
MNREIANDEAILVRLRRDIPFFEELGRRRSVARGGASAPELEVPGSAVDRGQDGGADRVSDRRELVRGAQKGLLLEEPA